MMFDWKQYYITVNLSFDDDTESKDMALTRDELKALTEAAYNKTGQSLEDDYNKWAFSNPVLPTMKNDPDFGVQTSDGQTHASGMVWNDRTARWEKKSLPYKPPESYRKILEAEFQGEDNTLPVLETVAEATIHMMEKSEDKWNDALDIIFGDDNEGQDKKGD